MILKIIENKKHLYLSNNIKNFLLHIILYKMKIFHFLLFIDNIFYIPGSHISII